MYSFGGLGNYQGLSNFYGDLAGPRRRRIRRRARRAKAAAASAAIANALPPPVNPLPVYMTPLTPGTSPVQQTNASEAPRSRFLSPGAAAAIAAIATGLIMS